MVQDEIVPDTWSFEKNTEVYGAVFRFMYGLKYDNLIVSSCMRFHAEVFQLAVCLGVSELRNLAKKKFKKCIKTAWDADEFLKVLVMAKFLFPEYCMSVCREHIDELSNKPEFENVLRCESELARKLTMMLGKSLRSYCCPQCNQTWSLDCSLSSPSYCPICGHHEQDWDKFRK
ncbi:hypothetical protein DPV78_009044 [Talaromyces pinophilus]|jgi:hypothetical protein|nr:hypothetical protein DPV78_009044 [Talaromyces pinophilus]